MKLINKKRRKKNKKTRGKELTDTTTQLKEWLEVNNKTGRITFQEELIKRPMKMKEISIMTSFIRSWLQEPLNARKQSN